MTSDEKNELLWIANTRAEVFKADFNTGKLVKIDHPITLPVYAEDEFEEELIWEFKVIQHDSKNFLYGLI
jgi:hypothetical protein